MTKNEIAKEYVKVEVLIESVNDLITNQHYEAAGIIMKRLGDASLAFKGLLSDVPPPTDMSADAKKVDKAAPDAKVPPAQRPVTPAPAAPATPADTPKA